MTEPLRLELLLPEQVIEQIAQRILEHFNRRDTAEQPPVSPWLTFNQACVYLGLSRNALYKLTAARAIPCRKKQAGQGLRFHRDELDRWMRETYPRLDRLG